jgi:hypothetical protein
VRRSQIIIEAACEILYARREFAPKASTPHSMQKPLALSIAVCLGLTGCHVFQGSDTWQKAMRVRPGETTRDPDPSNAYAAKLHTAFAADGIEHKVVVYQYRYTTRLREEAVGTRTAVIYRDNSTGGHPWWLKDDRLHKPVWLPNGELDRQVSFYIRRKAEVIETKNYPAQTSSKTAVAFARPKPTLRFAFPFFQNHNAVTKVAPPKKAEAAPESVRKPAPATTLTIQKPAGKPTPAPVAVRKTVEKPVPAKKSFFAFAKPTPARVTAKPTPSVAVKKPATAPVAAKPAPVPAIAKGPASKRPNGEAVAAKPSVQNAREPKMSVSKIHAFFQESLTGPVKEPEPVAAEETKLLESITSRSTSPWTPPATLDPAQQPRETAPRDRHLDKLFRAKHGTDYNPFSPDDRRKMQQLQKSLAARE